MLEKTLWQAEGRIILQVFSGDVSLAEMEQGWREVSALINVDEGKLPIHLVLDFTRRTNYTTDLFKLPAMRKLFELSNNARMGWFLVIQASPNPVLLYTSTLAARLIGRKFRVVASIDDALRYLYYTDSSLIKDEETSHPPLR